MYGVGPAVQGSLCSKSVYTQQFIDERPMSMRSESKCAAVIFVVAYAPTVCTKDAFPKGVFWQKLKDLVGKIPTQECLYSWMPTRELDRGWRGAVIIKVECLEHMDVMFVTIVANDSCRSPPITS